MRAVAIIQARMGSSRLPGKILMPLAGRPVLQHVIDRVWASGAFSEVVVATTDRPTDDEMAQRAAEWGARAVRGDETDVLSRFGVAAEASGAEAIMRITADCPLIDPDVLAAMVRRFVDDGSLDLLSNCITRTFPRGLDAELFTRAALDRALAEARTPSQREHVTPYLYDPTSDFRIAEFLSDVDASHLRLTLDTPEDFALLDTVFSHAEHPDAIRLADIIRIFRDNPQWVAINAHIEQKKI
jgi:spore coat polysaccharide biosynthesis protein SpsF